MEIRCFNIEDTNSVINLWRECGLTVPWNDPDKDIERKLAVGADLFLVGDYQDELIASVMGGYEGHRGWVNYLAVHPDHRRAGYGRRLMNEVESRLLVRGCPKLNLQIRSSNENVKRFYAAIGYKQDEVVSYGKRLIPDDKL